jgi:ubiquitin carboxyl-terminal hydrolase 47
MLQVSRQRSIDTRALTRSFGWEGSEVFQQHDVQELCRVLFDALEETFKTTQHENLIDRLYAGQLIDYIKCKEVNYQSERDDKFLDASLVIHPFGTKKVNHSLDECIRYFLKPEILEGENKYYCEKYQRKVDAIKGLKFRRLPYVFTMQLKRFDYDPRTFNRIKLNDQVRC